MMGVGGEKKILNYHDEEEKKFVGSRVYLPTRSKWRVSVDIQTPL